jgi:hypothetical protein
MKHSCQYLRNCLSTLALTLGLASASLAQATFDPDTVKAGTFDNGKMWTFDFPPTDYWAKTYGFKPDQAWLDNVRLSALRFASWCSASFVSPNGLVMTNHHCSRDVATKVQRAGENFTENGFVAAKLGDERRVEDLYVDQLVKLEDVTARVQKAMDRGTSDADQVKNREAEFAAIKAEYAKKDGWAGLELQTITFYNGGRYSLYGFKRYKDVRLVLMPELQLGYYGGDSDNFTYPRYCLDFTFWRVYDDNGQPLKTQHYFKFNPNGVKEGEPTFVIGNPGRTSRQWTVADLEYSRDISIPAQLLGFRNTSAALKKYNETAKSDSVLNDIFSLENTIKARAGALKAIQDPYIMARRRAFEKQFQAAAREKFGPERISTWSSIEATRAEFRKAAPAALALNFSSTGLQLAQNLLLAAGAQRMGLAPEMTDRLKKAVLETPKPPSNDLERDLLRADLTEIVTIMGQNDPAVKQNLGDRSPDQWAADILANSKLYDPASRSALLQGGNPAESNDPALKLVAGFMPSFMAANQKLPQLNSALTAQRARLARTMYDIYGTSIPPDATFSLRISDGLVKGYEYNGTRAPIMTNFYGLFELNHSFGQSSEWKLPARWLAAKRTPEFLQTPLNFVSTNDIIGGNSGSPMINQRGEAIGLIFDGNIESLSGDYIYLPEFNRTVSVHAGGILAALKHVYKAKRVAAELEGK